MDSRIRLIEPGDGAVTRPLQRYAWPADDARGDDGGGRGGGSAPEPILWDDLAIVGVDRSLPEAVLFRWEAPGAAEGRVTYDLHLSQDPDFRNAFVVRDLCAARAEVVHLHIATRYYWRVVGKEDGREVRRSPAWSFTTHHATPRWIAVPGITNVRDLGGWPVPGGRRVRQGRVYRSSEMNSHVEIAPEGKRVLIEDLRIRTDLDLRGSTEAAQPVLDPARVEWINIPVEPYEAIGDPPCQDGYRRVFAVFADASKYPILFHCWGGADRAGTVAFLLSALLGKSREDLFRDYELTSLSIWGLRSRRLPEFQGMLRALEPYAAADGINRQVENYLLAIGVTPDEIGRIRGQLIAPAG
jgi:protein-tyrosine phosphatase